MTDQVILTKREKKLRYEKPWLAIMYFCIPTVLIMVIQGLYNIVDKSLALTFATGDLCNTYSYKYLYKEYIDPSFDMSKSIPYESMRQYINVATQYATQTYSLQWSFSVMAGMGCATNYAISYGNRDYRRMQQIAGNGFSSTIIFSVLVAFFVFAIIFPGWNSVFIRAQMGNSFNPITMNLAWDFQIPMLAGAPLMFLSYYFVTLLRSEGRINWIILIVLSSILINASFSIFFMRVTHLKLTGAMMGTVASWFVQVIWGYIIMFRFKNSYGKFKLYDVTHIKLQNVLSFMKDGLPNFISNVSLVVTSFVSTLLVVKLPQEATSNHISPLQELISSITPWLSLILSAGLGVTQGSRVLISYNYGARKYERIWQILKRSSILLIFWFCFILIIISIFGKEMMELFALPPKEADKYYTYIILYFASYPLCSVTYICLTLYQGIGKSGLASFTNSLRAFVIALPMSIIGYFVALATGDSMFYFLFCGLFDLVSSLILIPILIHTWLKYRNSLHDEPDNFILE